MIPTVLLGSYNKFFMDRSITGNTLFDWILVITFVIVSNVIYAYVKKYIGRR